MKKILLNGLLPCEKNIKFVPYFNFSPVITLPLILKYLLTKAHLISNVNALLLFS